MWIKWLPWRIIITSLARRHGFIDPIQLAAAMGRIAQPSEVIAPVELLRLGAVLHARGLINSQVIQNNLDWIWPYWVQRQFDPSDSSFVPRAFSLTHINLTHRNWTAVGIPGADSFPIVDPKGLVTPLYDGWSIDSWVVNEEGYRLFPCKAPDIRQKLEMQDNLAVTTSVRDGSNYLFSRVEVENEDGRVVCKIRLKGGVGEKGHLVVSLRPFNPEGVSFVHSVSGDRSAWLINGKDRVLFDEAPVKQAFSDYGRGDVGNFLYGPGRAEDVTCDVGLCTAASFFDLDPGSDRNITVTVPLQKIKKERAKVYRTAGEKWTDALSGATVADLPDEKFSYLYNAAIRNIALLSPGKVYAGPYTYKQFWFRDAVYALDAMLSSDLREKPKEIIDGFLRLQTPTGYFKSQDGEWDSNGQVLWIMNRYCELTGEDPDKIWQKPVIKAVNWIRRKRIPDERNDRYAGLLPAGFSAEHFGPNDHYYWDDLWGVAGLDAGRTLLEKMGMADLSAEIASEKKSFLRSINTSIERARKEQGITAIPSSPTRRLDSSSVGVLVGSYPLKIYGPGDRMIKNTVDHLIQHDFLNGLFFHEIAHSGINIYLSLQIAQVLLRMEDPRFFDIAASVAAIASDTGQWPEAIHPWTGGGCMGDGQHLWASAEWIMFIRNCFVREEDGALILCSGVPEHWIRKGKSLFFGPTATSFGDISVRAGLREGKIEVSIEAGWRGKAPRTEVRIPGYAAKELVSSQASVMIGKKTREEKKA